MTCEEMTELKDQGLTATLTRRSKYCAGFSGSESIISGQVDALI